MLMMGQSSTCGWSFLVLLLSVVSSQASNLRSTGDFVPETDPRALQTWSSVTATVSLAFKSYTTPPVNIAGTSIYYLATDSKIGPTRNVWWGGAGASRDTLAVPMIASNCGNIKVLASIKAQNKCGDSYYQMHAGRLASMCNEHALYLELDGVAENPWLHNFEGCKFETQAESPIAINAFAWHKDHGVPKNVVQALKLAFVVDLSVPTSTVQLGSAPFISNPVKIVDSSIYFLSADPTIGPSKSDATQGSRSTLMVPMVSADCVTAGVVVASIKAQNKCGSSSYQMNTISTDCTEHNLYLELDDATQNPWLKKNQGCKFESPDGAVAINAYPWHGPDRYELLETMRYSLVVDVPITEITTVSIGSKSFTAPPVNMADTSIYYLATDPDIGPTKSVWWGISRDTLMVPMVASNCHNVEVLASVKAQNKCGNSYYQMNAGRLASICSEHALHLELDGLVENPWLKDFPFCKFESRAGSTITIEAYPWHKNSGVAQTLHLAFVVDLAETAATTVQLGPGSFTSTPVKMADNSIFFLSSDPAIGPSQGVWWWDKTQGTTSTLLVPMIAYNCHHREVVASIKAQNKCGNSYYQMNAGRSANMCSEHSLYLELNGSTQNPWLNENQGCKFETRPESQVTIKVYPWHGTTRNTLVDTMHLAISVELPLWSEAVLATYGSDNESLQQCEQSLTPPKDGSQCIKQLKFCFFGNQKCPSGITYPSSKCTCGGDSDDEFGVWSCEPQACP